MSANRSERVLFVKSLIRAGYANYNLSFDLDLDKFEDCFVNMSWESWQAANQEQQEVIANVFKVIHDAYMGYENETLETVYDKIKEILK